MPLLYKLSPDSRKPAPVDINRGPESSNPFDFEVKGNALYFGATTEEHGTEVYRPQAGHRKPVLVDVGPGEFVGFPPEFYVI